MKRRGGGGSGGIEGWGRGRVSVHGRRVGGGGGRWVEGSGVVGSTRVHVGGWETDVFVGRRQATPVGWRLHWVIRWHPHYLNHGQRSLASEINPEYE